MPLDACLLAFGAAILHAVWNLLVAGAEDSRAATAVMLLIGTVALAPVAAATWDFSWRALPYAASSALVELLYVALLALAYTRSELSVVYPIARGVAPVVVLVVSVTFLGVSTSAPAVAGIVLVALGVLLVSGARRGDPLGVPLALAIAASIAGYTLLDKEGLHHAAPAAYLQVVSLLYAPAFGLTVAVRRGLAALRSQVRGRIVLGGIATVAAYGLVLAALDRAPAAPVAAVRESSVLIATVLAYFVLGEQVGRRRAAGATAIVAGVALVSLS
jgi:drug/metabolite transporter (DMT)-like permease